MIERDKVVVAAGPYVIAVDARTGDKRWVFQAGDLVVGTPTVSGRTVLVGSRDGVMYAINDLTGRPIWRYPAADAGPPIQSSPLLVGDIVLVRRGARDVLALRQNDGALVWEYALPEPPAAGQPQPGMDMGGMMMGAPPMMGGAPPGVPGGGGAAPAGYDPITGLPFYTTAVRSGVVAQGGQAFLVGDDGVVYGFKAQAPDALKPEIKKATLQVQIQQQQYAYELKAIRPGSLAPTPTKDDVLQTPGAPPLWLHAEVLDPGTGVNPEKLQVLLGWQTRGAGAGVL